MLMNTDLIGERMPRNSVIRTYQLLWCSLWPVVDIEAIIQQLIFIRENTLEDSPYSQKQRPEINSQFKTFSRNIPQSVSIRNLPFPINTVNAEQQLNRNSNWRMSGAVSFCIGKYQQDQGAEEAYLVCG